MSPYVQMAQLVGARQRVAAVPPSYYEQAISPGYSFGFHDLAIAAAQKLHSRARSWAEAASMRDVENVPPAKRACRGDQRQVPVGFF